MSNRGGFESNYERLPWHKKPKNWIFPVLMTTIVIVMILSTITEEYHRVVEEHKDVTAALSECKWNPPQSAHNRQSCWEASLKASRSPYTMALSNTGARLFKGVVTAIQAIGKSYIFTLCVAVSSALGVLYCISSSSQSPTMFMHPFPQFNPYMMFHPQHHTTKSSMEGIAPQQHMMNYPTQSINDNVHTTRDVTLLATNHSHIE